MVKNKNKNKKAKKREKHFLSRESNPGPSTGKVISSCTVSRHQMSNGGGYIIIIVL